MITLPIGYLIMLGVLIYSVLEMDFQALVNAHSFVIVVAGTISIFFVTAPSRVLLGAFRAIKELRNEDVPNKSVQQLLAFLASDKNFKDAGNLHPLISYAQDLWDQGIDKKVFELLLTQRLEDLNTRTEKSTAALRNLAKYPPVLGMAGTVLGMIALFSNLNADNKENIGPSLALAMTATFYGLALANFIILPLADRMHVRHLSRVKRNEMVFNALLFINREEPEAIVKNVYKEPNSRVKSA
jgi:chemotaxis protein MotA